jgi:DNA polymerase (family 10)
MPSNKSICKLFSTYAELLQVHEQDERLSNLLAGAAYRIGRMGEEVMQMDIAVLKDYFKPQIVARVKELKETGTIAELEELIQLTPSGIFEMMQLKGLGGKKLSFLWKHSGIDSMDALLKACSKGVIAKLPGFGAKTQSNIIAAIEQHRSHEDRFHYAAAADEATALLELLQEKFNLKLTALCGEVRRKCNTLSAIEIVTTITSSELKKQASLRKAMVIQHTTAAKTTGSTLDEFPLIIYHVIKKDFYTSLFTLTGNEAHVQKVLSAAVVKTTYPSEEAIYKDAQLPFIVPEMREDCAEWNFTKRSSDLITMKDITGVVHNHTTYSDGIDTLEDFVKACKKKKYEYVVISDHSKNAHYAGGLKEKKILQQHKEIDALNKTLSPFKIFKSIECDILVSGELDYEESILKKFDLVIISVHQLLKMNEEKATRRLIKAIENPYTTILGHMTGRQLLIRPGYPVDFKKVIDACAANNVVIEINANPYRLDVDWSHLPYALKQGVMISINPDAHSIGEIDNIRWGVESARKGGLTKDRTWNALPLEQIKKWIKSRH